VAQLAQWPDFSRKWRGLRDPPDSHFGSRGLPGAASLRCLGVSVSRRDIEYFQPARVFLGSVPDNVRAFNISLRPITLSEID
jgi:hypothetical protein